MSVSFRSWPAIALWMLLPASLAWGRAEDASKEETALRERIQKAFATSKQPVLRETRVDAVTLTRARQFNFKPVVTCNCVTIYYRPEDKEKPPVADLVTKTILDLLDTDPTFQSLKDRGAKAAASITEVLPHERPNYVLQNAAAANPALDGTLLEQAFYDDKGTLVLKGRIPDAAARDALEKLLKDEVRKQEGVGRPWCRADGKKETPRWSLTGLEPTAWRVPLDLQQRLASRRPIGVTKFLNPLRVDRVYFTYSGKESGVIGELQLQVPGQQLPDRSEYRDQTDRKEFDVKQWLYETLPQYREIPAEVVKEKRVKADFKVFSEPWLQLQPLIAAREVLDGVRVDKPAAFGADGQMLLQGVWRDEKTQRPALQKLCDAYYRRTDALTRVSLKDFQELPTDKVLKALRERQQLLEDVRIDRLYFDSTIDPESPRSFQLRVTGIFPERTASWGWLTQPALYFRDQILIQQWLTELSDDLLKGKKSARTPGPRVQLVSLVLLRSALADPVESTRVTLRPWMGLATELRERIQYPTDPEAALNYDPKWDGILVRRGYFDPDGVYVVDALVDSDAQGERLAAVVNELAKDPRAQAQLSSPWRRKYTRQSVAPMLRRLQVVLPTYPVFDGLTLLNAVHDVNNRLLLRVGVVGPQPGRAARAEIQRLLNTSSQWRLRSGSGVTFRVVTSQERNPEWAETVRLKATSCMRLCDIDSVERHATTALLHDPGDSTAWFLRALALYMRGEKDQAERDLRRVALREANPDDGDYRSALRVRQLEVVQGPFRRLLEVMLARMVLDVRANKQPVVRLD